MDVARAFSPFGGWGRYYYLYQQNGVQSPALGVATGVLAAGHETYTRDTKNAAEGI